MTLLIDGQGFKVPGRKHTYLSVTLDDRRIPVPFMEFWTLLLLSSRLLQGTPKVHSNEIWGLLTNRYIYRVRDFIKQAEIPAEIINTRDFCYQIRFKNEIDVRIDSSLLASDDYMVREEVKRYLATREVASCSA